MAKKEKDNDFELFQTEFKKWQTRLGLTGFRIFFKHLPLVECFAQIDASQVHRVATVTLNSKLSNEDKAHKDVKRSAKHEAMHLLVNNLEACATSREIRIQEIDEAVEELVVKLTELIPELKDG